MPSSRWGRGVLAVLAGAVPAAAFPEPSLWWLAYVGLVPWMLLVRSARDGRRAALDGWLGGLGFTLAVHHWLLPHLHVFTVVVAALLGLLWAPWGWLVHRFLHGVPGGGRAVAGLAVVPSAWLLVELVRSWEALGGPWGLLGASQWQVPAALRVASVGGVWLVTLLVVAVNTAVTLLVAAASAPAAADAAAPRPVRAGSGAHPAAPHEARAPSPYGNGKRPLAPEPATRAAEPSVPVPEPTAPAAEPAVPPAEPTDPVAEPTAPPAEPTAPVAEPAARTPEPPGHRPATPPRRPAVPGAGPAAARRHGGSRVRPAAAAGAALAACAVAVAGVWVRYEEPAASARLRVAVVQPGVFDGPDGAERRFARGEELTRALAGRDVDLVVWGESSVGADLAARPDLSDRLAALSRELGAEILVNVDARRSDLPGIYKSSVLVDAGGPTGDRYDKMRLVPFGEYVPARSLLGWATSVGRAAEEDRRRGERPVVMPLGAEAPGDARLGPLVCFETAFPDMSRRLVRDGADVLVAQSATSTFQGTWAPEQHASLGALRAAETARPMVHATLTGVTAVYGPDGARIGVPLGTERSAAAVYEVPLTEAGTPYVRFGDWPVKAAAAVLAGAAGAAAVRELRRRSAPGSPVRPARTARGSAGRRGH
nr:apolipoprotein N-acyltransferase [Streptomyces sp. CC228A]